MASMPPQAVRRQSSAPSSSDDQDTTNPSPGHHPLEDSQTVLVDHPSSSPSSSASTTSNSNAAVSQKASAPPPQAQEEQDLRKCWICFSDESEDTPQTSRWRDPCPCALVAHEDCLLDWIADMESPSSRKRTLGPPKLACPQCKSEIKLSRPRSLIVETIRAMERVSAKMVAPAAVVCLFGGVVHACAVHGVYTINSIFGPEDAKKILAPFLKGVFEERSVVQRARDFLTHWRIHVGLPLITPLLVLSRTGLANTLLPVLPVFFFATQGDVGAGGDNLALGFTGLSWPPSASMTIAVLPYLRSAYNFYYSRVWAEREKKWIREIQPRSGQQADSQQQTPAGGAGAGAGIAAAQDMEDMADEAENNLEIRIDANIWDDWGNVAEADEQQGNQQGGIAPALNEPPLPDNEPQLPQQQQQQQQQEGQQQQANERLLSFSTTALAESILGALLFPTIASLSGEALNYLLHLPIPPSLKSLLPFGLRSRVFTGGRSTVGQTGLLSHKWGRSIVGGCLFVVVKDAVMLYVRWKMARQHKQRRIMDFDRKGSKKKGN